MLRSVLLATAASATLAPAAFAQAPAPAQPPARPAASEAQPQAPAVEGVTVTGQRDGMRSSIDRRSYSVANDLRASSGSVADVLRNVPSVEVDVQGNVSLRGDPNVTILSDGKPSGMFQGEGRGDALQQLPADQIDRIEVMTNPSAAFRPDGPSGVINLVTKKNRRPGQYVTVRGNVGTGGRVNGGVSGAYTGEKLTLSGDIGLRKDRQEGSIENERARLVGGQFVESRQRSDIENNGRMINLRAGIDYDISAMDRISAEVRHRGFGFESESHEVFEGEDAAGAIARAYDRFSDGEFVRTNSAGSVTWRRKLTGPEHDLVSDFTFDRSEGRREFDARILNTLPTASTGLEEIRNDTTQDIARLKVDYNRPIGDSSRLKTGGEIELTDNTYDNFGARGTAPGGPVVDPNLTNSFVYEQAVQAVYATYERPFTDKLTVQAGLRAENVQIDLHQVTTGQREENDYFELYPSLHMGYALSETQRLSASYSLRTQRPRPEVLNPFVVYIDPFNLRAGNPRLEPQMTHSFEAGWQFRKQQSFYLATLYFRATENGVTEVTRDLGGGVLLTTFENLAERRAGGLELVANGQITKKLTYNVSGNLFWEEIEASNLGFSEPRSGTSVQGRANLNWTPTDKDFFQLNAFMAGRRLLPQGYVEPFGMLNFGYRRKVNDKLSLLVTAQDVLDSFRQNTVIETPTLRDRTERRFSNRAVFAGFTYNFSKGPPRRQREPGFEFDAGAAGPPT